MSLQNFIHYALEERKDLSFNIYQELHCRYTVLLGECVAVVSGSDLFSMEKSQMEHLIYKRPAEATLFASIILQMLAQDFFEFVWKMSWQAAL